METAAKQDMPPKGGYSPINFKRIPARSYFNGYQLFAGYAVITSVAAYLYFRNLKRITREDVEMRSGSLALEPLLIAERDREFLKQVKRNRAEEEKLMSGVEGWEVGTYYGEPIYKTVDNNKFIDPVIQEYFAHGPSGTFARRAFFSFWT
ncbi:NADH dehydrogenase (ubiquinone) B16.6 subunit [Oratosquilla oratoria]|uniref:NADH dehydrogenase (ubiquinone) B16.6 subunit n=1 Tax=Oratosquilla oratoria TaxID=337810 RepID=UPI003F761443